MRVEDRFLAIGADLIQQHFDIETTARQSWTLFNNERPWTTNTERGWHRMERANTVKRWRETFGWLAIEQKIPKLRWATFHAIPVLSGKGRPQDASACHPAVKAAIDGIVDAGVLPEDNPKYVKSITFHVPTEGGGTNGLILVMMGEPA